MICDDYRMFSSMVSIKKGTKSIVLGTYAKHVCFTHLLSISASHVCWTHLLKRSVCALPVVWLTLDLLPFYRIMSILIVHCGFYENHRFTETLIFDVCEVYPTKIDVYPRFFIDSSMRNGSKSINGHFRFSWHF